MCALGIVCVACHIPQLLTVHWRRLVETSAPVLGRRTRTFTSEAASTTFSSVIKVAMTVLATEASSPALLRMTMHFLQLLDKVCSVGNLFLCRCASHAPTFSPSGLDVGDCGTEHPTLFI